MDSRGRITDFNAAAEATFGHRQDDVVGRVVADLDPTGVGICSCGSD